MPEHPIRVCFLIAYFHPYESGAERQALAQAEELTRLGHQVHVLTHATPEVPTEEDLRGIQIHRRIRSSKRGGWFAPSFVASAVRGLRRLRGEYDLIHAHQALWEAVAAGVARTGFVHGRPSIIQPASSGYFGEAQELQRTKGAAWLRRMALRNDCFVAISAEIEQEWRALGVPENRMRRIASGVDASRYHPGASALDAAWPARPRVVFTGRLHPQKNLDVLMEAWPAVAKATGASLMLVGHGPERERLEAKATALGVAGSVHFVGVLPDVAEALRAADAFALPSVAEGMSNSLLEAMATGLPCVASDIGGNQDLLGAIQGRAEAGVLVGAATAARWSEALIALLNNPARRTRLGEEASRRIHEVYGLRRVVSRYVALYREVLGRDPQAGA